MAKSNGIPPEAVEITRINERQRTIRWTVTSVAVVTCVWLISDAIVEILNKPDPLG